MSHSILVVDDEPMARTLLRLMLVREGFEVLEAQDGLEALRQIDLSLPALIILDVMMPGMDGFTVCKELRLRKDTRHLPVIMLSAKTDAESVNKGLAAGANKYLTKPISPEDLTSEVRESLKSVGADA